MIAAAGMAQNMSYNTIMAVTDGIRWDINSDVLIFTFTFTTVAHFRFKVNTENGTEYESDIHWVVCDIISILLQWLTDSLDCSSASVNQSLIDYC